MLQQTVNDPNRDTPFVFASDMGVDVGTFEEASHGHAVALEKPIWFSLEIGPRPASPAESSFRLSATKYTLPDRLMESFRMLDGKSDHIRIDIAANYNTRKRRMIISDFQIHDQVLSTGVGWPAATF